MYSKSKEVQVDHLLLKKKKELHPRGDSGSSSMENVMSLYREKPRCKVPTNREIEG